jgi:ferredoxin
MKVSVTAWRGVEVEVTVDSSKCQGHARCHALAPEAFDLDEDGYPVVTPNAATLAAADLNDAAAACPEQAITILP